MADSHKSKKKRKKEKRKHFLDGWLGVEFNNL